MKRIQVPVTRASTEESTRRCDQISSSPLTTSSQERENRRSRHVRRTETRTDHDWECSMSGDTGHVSSPVDPTFTCFKSLYTSIHQNVMYYSTVTVNDCSVLTNSFRLNVFLDLRWAPWRCQKEIKCVLHIARQKTSCHFHFTALKTVTQFQAVTCLPPPHYHSFIIHTPPTTIMEKHSSTL